MRQPMFFVATAPLSGDGHVNVSPKGLDGTFVVLGPIRVAYLDLTGSGIETIAHVRENERITLMFCAFEGPPNIVRLHGRGTVHTPDDESWSSLIAQFPSRPGVRAVVTTRILRVSFGAISPPGPRPRTDRCRGGTVTGGRGSRRRNR